ncbi:structural maintenance of chromosomes protein 2-like [Oscarella lobularis]|uniref:structural maintenance of chromosomes protein 2-like n=1 Tax=Oscarella lobularis TaxID=121494 RepID=UPI0033133CC9
MRSRQRRRTPISKNMYVKEIVLDGFKSYAQRTVISGFDPLFNAITGLNGSGKSNILDAICFLLGISNLSQVRVVNLQELVYKSGQAGVTKATVTITFDNTDKNQSPVGYEGFDEITVCRQIVIGGRNKYLVNGVTVNNGRVQDLFRSVQLNVNNPHFLIMQGRITKVLNMKPPEILAMMEEAAGTRMYESKKASAVKTIAKKDSKLQEIEKILAEEITPTLEKLKEERASYLEFQNIGREIEHLNRLVVAYQYTKAEEIRKRSSGDTEEMMQQVKEWKDGIQQINEQLDKLQEEIAELERKRDAETGGSLKALEEKVDKEAMIVVKCKASVDNLKDQLAAEQKKKTDLEKSAEDESTVLAGKETQLATFEETFSQLQEAGHKATEKVERMRKHFQAISAGLCSSSDTGEDQTFADQLITYQNQVSTAQTEIKQAQMRLSQAQDELKKHGPSLKETERNYRQERKECDGLIEAANKLQMEISRLNFDESKKADLEKTRAVLDREVRQLQMQMNEMEQRFPSLQFEYKDPQRGFDRSKVHGLVAKLVKVRKISTATSLEVAAGGKLYNVVVDSEVTGKQLLQKGELKRRYTIIPLNKIAASTIKPQTVQRAKQLVGEENVHTALSLIGYDRDVKAAMEYVFGQTFVCESLEMTKKVTFDPKISTRSVSLDGDLMDPSGTLSGGSRPSRSSVLAALEKACKVEETLNAKVAQLDDVKRQLEGLESLSAKYHEKMGELELKRKEIERLEARLQHTVHHKQMEGIRKLHQTIAEQQEVIEEGKRTEKECSAKCKELEKKMKDSKGHRDKELKKAEKELNAAEKEAKELVKKMKDKEQERQAIELEVVELRKEVASIGEQAKVCDDAVEKLQKKIDESKEKLSQSEEQCRVARLALSEEKDKLKACNKDITARGRAKKKLEGEKNAAQLKVRDLEHTLERQSKETKEAGHTIEALVSKHEWILEEKKYFGQPGTGFDFKVHKPNDASQRLGQLEEQKKKLSRKVNMRAMNMLGKAEEKYQDLMKKREIVSNDKTKIEDVIHELDKKKEEALQKAHAQVNKDFGSIFSTLLPGTQAKLSPPEGLSVLDGLEVKVAFGDVWKENLTELSGGQRSLVALSLILSLLLFKPAPIYILDEVDAALDLSHTQNIGQMLKNHFQRSQFIVVSLKEGMFQNANVLFKTKFVDGVSTVTRRERQALPPVPTSARRDEEGDTSGKAKRPRVIKGKGTVGSC